MALISKHVQDQMSEISNPTTSAMSPLWIVGSMLLAAVLTAGCLVFVNHYAKKELTTFFITNRRRLRFLRWFVAVVMAGIVAVVFDVLDISSLTGNSPDGGDLITATVFSSLGTVYVCMLWLLWSCEDALERSVSRIADDLAEARLERAFVQEQLKTLRKVSQMLIQIMTSRWERILVYLNSRSQLPLRSPIEFADLSNALDSSHQLRLYLAALHAVLADRYNGGLTEGKVLRVALFDVVGDYLEPIASFDGASHDCITGPLGSELREHFRVNGLGTGASLAAHVSTQYHQTLPISVANTDKADAQHDHPYRHLSAAHRQRVRSVSVYPCRDCGGVAAARPVIVCDSNQDGFFSEEESARHTLRRILEDFSARMLYERTISSLLNVVIEESAVASPPKGRS